MAVDLMKILPEYFRPVIEFQQLMRINGEELDKLEQNVQQVKKNFFIQTGDAATIKMYEELFGITYKPGETLEYRRQRVLQMYNIIAPFSIGFFRNQLTAMFGDEYSLTVDPEKNILSVFVTSSRYGAVDLLYSLVWDIVPAHLDVTANHQVTSEIRGKLFTAGIMSSTLIQTI